MWLATSLLPEEITLLMPAVATFLVVLLGLAEAFTELILETLPGLMHRKQLR
jgi:hypothetical protein